MTPTPHSAHLDFRLLFDLWEKRADITKPDTCLYRDLINRIKDFPDLNQSPVDPAVLDTPQNRLGFGLILGSLFPMSGQEEKRVVAMATPFDLQPIYSTPAFKALFLNDDCSIKIPENLDVERMQFTKLLNIYGMIVDQIFGIKINQNHPMVFRVRDAQGINRHFQIRLNHEFVRVKAKGQLPDIRRESELCTRSSPDHYDVENWQRLLPLDLFEFSGFILMEADDITVSQSVATLNEAVLNQEEISSAEFVDIVEDSVKSLLGVAELKVGVAALQQVKGRLVYSNGRLANSHIIRTLCGEQGELPYQGVLEFLSSIQKPVLLNDLSSDTGESVLMSKIHEHGIHEVMLYPLKHKGELVGVLEICSLRAEAFEPVMLHHLNMLAPSLSIAFYKVAEQFNTRIKAIIRKKFTAIHPVVEWKFDEIALDYALAEEQGRSPEIAPVHFREVYPLYGAVDVKNSSQERNRAIQEDLLIQLSLAQGVLEKARSLHYLPVLDRMLEKIEEFSQRIQLILLSEEEVRVMDFFAQDFEPTFRHLSESVPDLRPSVEEYFQAIDPQMGVVYIHRKAFEQSLEEINLLIGQYLDREEVKIQQMFPHYFEKFKTDGVEYNIYIGQSLVKDRIFDPIYLKNLRLWQLQTLIDITKLVRAKSPSLDVHLETTQLILAHSAPLTISFRLDERKFDVEGAYNIRYEIIKKRIDKALIKGSGERLVQPGKIAIVYSQSRDAKEYLDFIRFFQNRQALDEEIEELELEDMQGVHGMKAIRVTVAGGNHSEFPKSELIAKGEKG